MSYYSFLQALDSMRRGLTISDATRTLRTGPTDSTDRPLTATAPVLESVPPPPEQDRKSTRLNSSHVKRSRMPSSA